MAKPTPREVDRKRWREEVLAILEDFPRQVEALQTAMEEFGTEFDLQTFKTAYETKHDMRAYNRVQAVERGLGRVQNYVADLAILGGKLALLELPKEGDEGLAERSFAALREADVINGQTHRALRRAQRARKQVEHSYVRVPAGKVHEAAILINETAGSFIRAYRIWISKLL